ncbi:hypothetical protein BJY01DRAFT_147491 [Aspergillus pseudoustus]|uniref:BZIP domain-containing protein n=1 Tax=Aspergillus pseudoustus TaxID=1810923 RepID=A0ABR4KAG5_9EURO
MSADQLLYPMDFSDRQDEWLDFDSLLQLPAGFVDSQPTSVESISPRDLDQSFTEVDFQNWDSDPTLFSQAMFPEIGSFEAPMEDLGQPQLDSFQHFVDPNDVLQPVPSQGQMFEPGFDCTWVTDVPNMEPYPSFRHMVESQAALDTRCFSTKEKRRDASIALHLQRLQNVPLPDFAPLASNTQLSSPDWSVSSLDAMPSEPSYTTPGTSPVSESLKSPSPSSGPDPGAASMQLVLDLNMNTTTNVPRKQKPRSKAQRENYIKARKYGVCEKHRKQHKRCNCLKKAAAASLTPTTPASTPLTVIPGSRTNHERVLSRSSKPGSGQGHMRSTNTGHLRPLVWQATTAQGLGLSMLQDQLYASPTGHDRATAPTARPSTSCGQGSLNPRPVYRDREANKQQARLRSTDERARQDLGQDLLQPMDSPTKTQPQTLRTSQGALNRHRSLRLNVDSPAETRTQTLRVSQGTLNVHRNLHRTVESPAETNTQTVCARRGTLNTRGQGDTIVQGQTPCVTRGSLNTHRQRQEATAANTQTQQLCTANRGAQNVHNTHTKQCQDQVQRQASHYLFPPSPLGGSGHGLSTMQRTALGVFSLWQRSTMFSSWAGLFLRRLAVFSSGIIIASRKGMGFF